MTITNNLRDKNYALGKELADYIEKRDTQCVYCGKKFSESVKPTVEHIINDIDNKTKENVALCCNSCNISKGQRSLSEWLKAETPWRKNNVSNTTISKIVIDALKK